MCSAVAELRRDERLRHHVQGEDEHGDRREQLDAARAGATAWAASTSGVCARRRFLTGPLSSDRAATVGARTD